MSDYTATLEAQNEELKQLLAKSEMALIELHDSTDTIVEEHKVLQPKWYRQRIHRRSPTGTPYVKSVYVYTVWGLMAHIGWVEEYGAGSSFAAYGNMFDIHNPPPPTATMVFDSLDDAKCSIQVRYREKIVSLIYKNVVETEPAS